MSTVRLEPLLHQSGRESFKFIFPRDPGKGGRFSRFGYNHKTSLLTGTARCLHCRHNSLRLRPIRAGITEAEIAEATDALFQQTFPLTRTQSV